MSAEAEQIHQSNDDLNTTAPQSKPEAWKMPEPVFRRTSGKLPRAFVDEVNATMSSGDDVEAHSSDVSTEPDPPIAAETPAAKPKSGVLKILVVALALGAMIGFIVVLVTVVYFLFLR